MEALLEWLARLHLVICISWFNGMCSAVSQQGTYGKEFQRNFDKIKTCAEMQGKNL
jgi:hypothetical protein